MIDEKRLEMPPVSYIRELMESIKDGKVTITYYEPVDPPYSLDYNVSCTAADTEDFVTEYLSIAQTLEAIGEAKRHTDEGAVLEELLTAEQLDVWNTYIRDFDEEFDAGDYDLDVIYDMRDSGAQLDDDEQEVLERHHEWYEAQCLKRLPMRAHSPILLVNRAQRYEAFVRYNAPKTVIMEAGRTLTEEMLLYRYRTEETK